jgi:hypothetical protein
MQKQLINILQQTEKQRTRSPVDYDDCQWFWMTIELGKCLKTKNPQDL